MSDEVKGKRNLQISVKRCLFSADGDEEEEELGEKILGFSCTIDGTHYDPDETLEHIYLGITSPDPFSEEAQIAYMLISLILVRMDQELEEKRSWEDRE